MLRAEMAAQLTKLALDLRAVGKRQMRLARTEQVQSLDLKVERRLASRVETLDELVNRLRPVRRPVVDRLKSLVKSLYVV